MKRPNMILIVLYTLRYDYSHGLDKLLEYGFVKYENAYSTSPWTLPSHISMFTGLYLTFHGVYEGYEIRSVTDYM
ncbi:alkaline phosphatase family protein [Sulfolobus acidocaldarius]|nr:alkaline phosphatase family protein [Sulfolobus acidocaldarius]